MAERSTVRISTSGLHLPLASSGEVGGTVGYSDIHRLPRSPVVPRADGDVGRRALAHTSPDGCALSGQGPGEEPSSDWRPTYDLATERELLEHRCLSDAVIQTIQSAHAQSTARGYALGFCAFSCCPKLALNRDPNTAIRTEL